MLSDLFWKNIFNAPVDIKSVSSGADLSETCTLCSNPNAVISIRYANPTLTKDYTHHMCMDCARQYDVQSMVHPTALENNDVKLASELSPFEFAWDSLEKKLCPAGKAAAKKKFDVYPSAYANGWLVKTYKAKGGRYRMGTGRKRK